MSNRHYRVALAKLSTLSHIIMGDSIDVIQGPNFLRWTADAAQYLSTVIVILFDKNFIPICKIKLQIRNKKSGQIQILNFPVSLHPFKFLLRNLNLKKSVCRRNGHSLIVKTQRIRKVYALHTDQPHCAHLLLLYPKASGKRKHILLYNLCRNDANDDQEIDLYWRVSIPANFISCSRRQGRAIAKTSSTRCGCPRCSR